MNTQLKTEQTSKQNIIDKLNKTLINLKYDENSNFYNLLKHFNITFEFNGAIIDLIINETQNKKNYHTMYMFSMFTNEIKEEIDYKYIVNNILYDFVNNMFSYESIIEKMTECTI